MDHLREPTRDVDIGRFFFVIDQLWEYGSLEDYVIAVVEGKAVIVKTPEPNVWKICDTVTNSMTALRDRTVCKAMNNNCNQCPLYNNGICPSKKILNIARLFATERIKNYPFYRLIEELLENEGSQVADPDLSARNSLGNFVKATREFAKPYLLAYYKCYSEDNS